MIKIFYDDHEVAQMKWSEFTKDFLQNPEKHGVNGIPVYFAVDKRGYIWTWPKQPEIEE